MTEHLEGLVRAWRKEGATLDNITWVFTMAELTGKHPAEVYETLKKNSADLRQTIFGTKPA